MADKFKFTSWAEWDIRESKRREEEAERDRTNPRLIRIRETFDALDEERRLAQEEAKCKRIEAEEEAKRERFEIEEEAKRKRYEDVRLAVAAIKLEEEATPAADAELRRVLMERARAAKAAKAVKAAEAAEAAGKAKAAEIERLAPMVKAAFVLSGLRKLSITDKCVSQIRPHLPKEKQGAPVKRLKEAIRIAKDLG